MFGAAYLSFKARTDNKIAVYDPNNYFKGTLKSSDNLKFDFVQNTDTASSAYQKKGYTGLLVIPAWDGSSKLNYIVRSPKQLGISAVSKIEDKINNAIEDKVLQKQGISGVMLDSLRKTAPKADYVEITDGKGDVKASSSILALGIGYGSGILIYVMMFIYGSMVMRGVMEEKTSRIAEVIVSSVKPFQLMMGKILGIGAVGLTQFLLWLILIFGLVALSQLFIPHDALQQVQQMQQNNPMPGGMPKTMDAPQNILGMLSSANWIKIIPCFLFYFLGGYLFYAALFAAVGCMVNEDPQDAQSLMLPIMMPIIFGWIIMQSAVQNPDSPLAFWGSIIPFTSPIVMMARIPSDPPAWQIALSMALLIGGFLGTTWMAGKIYRTGILMYGKKGTWKQMMKWVFAKS